MIRKPVRIASILLIVLLLFFSCKNAGNPPPGDSADSSTEGEQTLFWAQNLVNDSWYQISATLRAVGTHSRVYVEDASSDLVSTSAAENIAAEFDVNVYPVITSTFGSTGDVNGDGAVTILLLDIADGFSGSGGYVAGYFHPYNEFARESIPGSTSNEQEMLYMDIDPGIPGNASFNSTMAHELQHLINFYQNYIVQDDHAQMDTWIDEGLSSGAEYVYQGSHTQWKIDEYNTLTGLDANGAYIRNNIRNGKNFLKWEGLLANYSTVYLFFQWLRIHASNSTGIYKEILDGAYDDYRAVEAAAVSRIYNGSLTIDWQEILRDWFVANQLSSTGSDPYNYGGDFTLNPPLNSGGVALTLDPGEGVYVGMAGSDTQTPSSPIDYAGINTSTSAVDAAGPDYAGDVLISFNHDGSIYGSGADTGILPSTVLPPPPESPVPLASRSLTAGEAKRYPMGTVFRLDDTLPPVR